MGWNFPISNKFTDLLANVISGPPPLLLIQEKDYLTCVICRKSFLKISISHLYRASTRSGLASALMELKRNCQENGFAHLWQGKITVCLDADNALFQDFHLPLSSRRKLKKTIPLLLDEELPLPPDSFSVKTFLTRQSGYSAIATVVNNSVLEEWRSCLGKYDFSAVRIPVFPWPLINALPSLELPSLLICATPSGNLVCALNTKGAPLRIQRLPSEPENTRHWAHQTRLLLSGLNFEPQNIIIFAADDFSDMKKAIIEEYNLPVHLFGKDLSPDKNFKDPDNNTCAKILARCLLSGPFRSFSPLAFTLEFKREKPKKFSLALPLGLCLALICGGELYSLYNSLNRQSKADRLKTLILERMRADLDNIPKNATFGRLTAILNSRLAELEKRDPATGGQFVTLLEDIHKACPADARIGLNRLSYDEKHIRLNGRAGSYEEVNLLKNSLEKINGIESARIVNATNIQGGGKNSAQIEFELDLALK